MSDGYSVKNERVRESSRENFKNPGCLVGVDVGSLQKVSSHDKINNPLSLP